MKKIKRLEAIGVITLNDRTADVGKKREYCSVSSVELDAQEVYIERLEREKEELIQKIEMLFNDFIPPSKQDEANTMIIDFGNSEGMQALVDDMRRRGW